MHWPRVSAASLCVRGVAAVPLTVIYCGISFVHAQMERQMDEPAPAAVKAGLAVKYSELAKDITGARVSYAHLQHMCQTARATARAAAAAALAAASAGAGAGAGAGAEAGVGSAEAEAEAEAKPVVALASHVTHLRDLFTCDIVFRYNKDIHDRSHSDFDLEYVYTLDLDTATINADIWYFRTPGGNSIIAMSTTVSVPILCLDSGKQWLERTVDLVNNEAVRFDEELALGRPTPAP
jgi:hypothetical protein